MNKRDEYRNKKLIEEVRILLDAVKDVKFIYYRELGPYSDEVTHPYQNLADWLAENVVEQATNTLISEPDPRHDISLGEIANLPEAQGTISVKRLQELRRFGQYYNGKYISGASITEHIEARQKFRKDSNGARRLLSGAVVQRKNPESFDVDPFTDRDDSDNLNQSYEMRVESLEIELDSMRKRIEILERS